MSTDKTTLSAWKMAIKNCRIKAGLIFHSDRGIRYGNHKSANMLESYKVI